MIYIRNYNEKIIYHSEQYAMKGPSTVTSLSLQKGLRKDFYCKFLRYVSYACVILWLRLLICEKGKKYAYMYILYTYTYIIYIW